MIAPYTSILTEAIEAIYETPYTGGYTNTQKGIEDCMAELSGQENAVIVVITDGGASACVGENGRICNSVDNGDCCKSDNTEGGVPPSVAAEEAADVAASKGMSVVPVAISRVESQLRLIKDLARCPGREGPCKKFQNLSVNSIDDLDDVLEELVAATTSCDLYGFGG